MSSPTDTDKEAIDKIVSSIQAITKEQAEPLIAEVFTAALQNGITLNLPEADGNKITLRANGSLSADNKLGLTANLKVSDYHIGDDVIVDGNLIAIVEIDFSKLNGNGISRETGTEPPYEIRYEKGSMLITIGSGTEPIKINSDDSLNTFIKDCMSNNSTIPATVLNALFGNLNIVADDALTIVKDFFANGYKLETEHFTVSVKGNLDWVFSDALSNMGSRDTSSETEGSGEGASTMTFGTFFKSISMKDLEILVSTNKEITLNDSGYQMRLVAKVNKAEMEPAKETIWHTVNDKVEQLAYDGIKFSIDADATLSILTTGRIGDNAIYAQGHFDGITGMFGEVDGQGKNYSAYLRFNGTDYNAVDLIGNIIASMKPSQGN